jgi:hypothetical protein
MMSKPGFSSHSPEVHRVKVEIFDGVDIAGHQPSAPLALTKQQFAEF